MLSVLSQSYLIFLFALVARNVFKGGGGGERVRSEGGGSELGNGGEAAEAGDV